MWARLARVNPAVMASDTVTDYAENASTFVTDDGVSRVDQSLEKVEERLASLSDKITLCNRVKEDLKDLSDVIVGKSLQDVSLPLQE